MTIRQVLPHLKISRQQQIRQLAVCAIQGILIGHSHVVSSSKSRICCNRLVLLLSRLILQTTVWLDLVNQLARWSPFLLLHQKMRAFGPYRRLQVTEIAELDRLRLLQILPLRRPCSYLLPSNNANQPRLGAGIFLISHDNDTTSIRKISLGVVTIVGRCPRRIPSTHFKDGRLEARRLRSRGRLLGRVGHLSSSDPRFGVSKRVEGNCFAWSEVRGLTQTPTKSDGKLLAIYPSPLRAITGNPRRLIYLFSFVPESRHISSSC